MEPVIVEPIQAFLFVPVYMIFALMAAGFAVLVVVGISLFFGGGVSLYSRKGDE